MSRYWRVLLLIVLAGFAVRVAYVGFAKLDETLGVNDQLFYNAAANALLEEGFVEPFEPGTTVQGTDPAADHPPLTIIVLAPVSFVSDQSPNAQRFTMALIGTATVLLLGLLGREVAGERAGWIAAGIGAFYPNLWVNDGIIMSESLAALVVTAALLLTYRMIRAPSVRTAVALGVVCALCALTRAELVLFIPALAMAGALVAQSTERRARLRLAVVTAVAAGVVVGPWVVYNMVRFEEPTWLSSNEGIALLGSNCDAVYHGDGTGLTTFECMDTVPPREDFVDQSAQSAEYRDAAFEYMGDHPGRAVVVAAARAGRTWSVFRPWDMVTYNEGEARERWVTILGIIAFYPLVIGAAAGFVVLHRRRTTWWPFLVPIIVVTVASAATYGQTRFRVPAEPSLVVLAAVAIDAFLRSRSKASVD